MGNLIFGVSGVRGIVNETLTAGVSERLGTAFATFCNVRATRRVAPTIAVGKDLRDSGKSLKDAFIKGVITTGLNVIDLGDCATPTVLFNIRELKIDGGAVITASHNPKEWNGVKFVNKEGTFLDATEMETLYKIYKSAVHSPQSANNGRGTRDEGRRTRDEGRGTRDEGRGTRDDKAIARHKKAVLNTVNIKLIQLKHYKVVFDSANGVLGKEGKEFLEEIGCEVIEETSERGLEPIPEHLSNLSHKVKKEKADIGFAVDPDGDRLSIVTELGTPLGEEYTLPLACSFVLKCWSSGQGGRTHKGCGYPEEGNSSSGQVGRTHKGCGYPEEGNSRKGVVVTNLSTSRMIEDVAIQNKCTVTRTKVGEVNVVQKMKEIKAVFGGEGNGGVIDPIVHYARDAIVGMGRILEYMASSNKKISELANKLPKYFIRKDKVKYRRSGLSAIPKDFGTKLESVIGNRLSVTGYRLKNPQPWLVRPPACGRFEINYEDGVRVDFKEGWLHLRKSNTEPIIRIICEAKNQTLVNSLIEEVKTELLVN